VASVMIYNVYKVCTYVEICMCFASREVPDCDNGGAVSPPPAGPSAIQDVSRSGLLLRCHFPAQQVRYVHVCKIRYIHVP